MHSAITAAALAAVAFILFQIASFLLIHVQNNRKAKRLGCQPAVRWPSDPFGYQNAAGMLKADADKQMPTWQQQRLETISQREGRLVHTHQLSMPLLRTSIVTFEPKNVQAILATQFKDFQLPLTRTGNFNSLLGTGIFAANGKQWEHSRALLRPQFVREQVSDLDLEERHVQNMMRSIDQATTNQDGWTDVFDIMPLFFRLTLDSATEFLFGESVDSQINEMAGSDMKQVPAGLNEIDFAYSFDQSQRVLANGSRMGNMWWLSQNKEFKTQCNKVHQFIDHFVQRALQQPVEKAADKERYVFLEALAEQTRDPVELRDQLLNILLAGRDTTASLLSWIFRILAQRPDVLEKLRSEILNVFGTYEHPKEITFSGLKNAQYLQWVLNEALRLYPVVPLNSRESSCDTTLPTGGGPDGTAPVFVPKGTEVLYSVS